MRAFLERLTAELDAEGLNTLGVVGRARYDAAAPPRARCDAILPGARSVIAVASGGRAHWDRMLVHIAGDPVARLARTRHPLDDFGKAVFARLGTLLEGCRVIHPHHDAPVFLSFIPLGELAGIGRSSEIGLVVNDRHGPWLGFRAAIFTPHALPETPVARRLCDRCPAPCRAACPGEVVGNRAFPWERCAAFREAASSPCRRSCAAREACVVAQDQMYPPLQRLYHADRAAGRADLCRMFGVADEVGV
ncbi:MAG: hypothetical protein U0166_18050 [Acidobacteriota bacterium]